MNYYRHDIRRHAVATMHLTLIECGAFYRLWQEYILSEGPIAAGRVYAVCKATTEEQRAAVDAVLADFYTLRYGSWHMAWAEEELAHARRMRPVLSQFAPRTPGARRRLALSKATPRCLCQADREAIRSIYAEAKRLSALTGVPHDVDHIVPLQGLNVSGLHVPANLRPLPASQNRSKGRAHR